MSITAVTGLHHLAVFAPGDVLFVIIAHAAVDMGITATAVESCEVEGV
jgi:hypothetical protein